VDPGIIHPLAVVGADDGLLVSGRALRSECHPHLADTKARARKLARPSSPQPCTPASFIGSSGSLDRRRGRSERR